MVIQTTRRRFVVALIVALVLACVVKASAQVMIPSGCKGLTPSDWEWWARQCYLYSFSDTFTPHAGFVVR